MGADVDVTVEGGRGCACLESDIMVLGAIAVAARVAVRAGGGSGCVHGWNLVSSAISKCFQAIQFVAGKAQSLDLVACSWEL